jgi:hypothetical protein
MQYTATPGVHPFSESIEYVSFSQFYPAKSEPCPKRFIFLSIKTDIFR